MEHSGHSRAARRVAAAVLSLVLGFGISVVETSAPSYALGCGSTAVKQYTFPYGEDNTISSNNHRFGIKYGGPSSQPHTGDDWGTPGHPKVMAVATGSVVLVLNTWDSETQKIFGKRVVLKQGDGIYTMYAHMQSISVSPGDCVKRSKPLGIRGETGLPSDCGYCAPHQHVSMSTSSSKARNPTFGTPTYDPNNPAQSESPNLKNPAMRIRDNTWGASSGIPPASPQLSRLMYFRGSSSSVDIWRTDSAGNLILDGQLSGMVTPNWVGAGAIFGPNSFGMAIYYGGSTQRLDTFRYQAGFGWSYVGSSDHLDQPDWAGIGDIDGNGSDDLVWYDHSQLHTLNFESDGSVSYWGNTPNIGQPSLAQLGDFNGDGHAELAWHSNTSSDLVVLRADSTGIFSWVGNTSGIGNAGWAGAGDIDGDGDDDLLWHEGTYIHVLRLQAGGQFALAYSNGGFGPSDFSAVVDLDGNGVAELYGHTGSNLGRLTFNAAGAATMTHIWGGITSPTRAAPGSFTGTNGGSYTP